MRLAWILLAALAIASSAWADGDSSPTSTTVDATTASTTLPAGHNDDQTTTTVGGGEEPANTEGPTGGPTDAPTVTDKPEEPVTDDGNTDKTDKPKTTAKVATTTVKTTVKAGSTTTKEPQPDVESFSVKCDKTSHICTYSMQVPGLDAETFARLMKETNDTETDVEHFGATDLVDLQAGVTKVFSDADATADYVQSQLDAVTLEIQALETLATDLQNDIKGITTDVSNANGYLNKILNKKSSCLYRQCVLKETTTPRPITTTTVRTTPTPFCKQAAHMGENNVCQNGGTCEDSYGSYYCTCTGNLDGDDEDCNTSVCSVFKTAQEPGFIFSPGYLKNGSHFADDDCDLGQWTVKAKDTKNILTLEEISEDWGSKDKSYPKDYISGLSADANLQLTVGKYKLKITKTTKYAQITQILAYGNNATISYSGPAEDYFHFTLKEVAP